MKSKRITARLLRSRGACDEQVQRFRELFPRGVVPTYDRVTAAAFVAAWLNDKE